MTSTADLKAADQARRASRNEYVKHHAPRILEAAIGSSEGVLSGHHAEETMRRHCENAIRWAVTMHDAIVAFQRGSKAPDS